MHFKRFLRELDLEQDSVFGMPNKNCTFEAFAWDAVGQSYIIFHAFVLFFILSCYVIFLFYTFVLYVTDIRFSKLSIISIRVITN